MQHKFFKHVQKYFKTYEHRWSDTTKVSLQSQFKTFEQVLDEPLDCKDTYERLSARYARSTVCTFWITLGSYFDFLLEEGVYKGRNVFKQWYRRNARSFKTNGERTRTVDITFSEAQESLIKANMPENARKTLLFILHTGLRRHEVHKLSSCQTTVLGKGQKTRNVYKVSDVSLPDKVPCDSELLRHCKKIGVYGPHALRKLYATRLSSLGIEPQDLCHVMGWSNLRTAYTYLQPNRDDKLRGLISA